MNEFKNGDKVFVSSLSLQQSVEGVVESVDIPRRAAIVRFEIFGRTVSAEFDFADLKVKRDPK
jgi:transcription antitermination factor NusG